MNQTELTRPLFALILIAVVLIAFPSAPASAETGSDIILVLDASGSMWGQIDGENKIVIARRVLGELIDGMEEGRRVGLVAYGHRREGDCEDIETLVPVGPIDKAGMKAVVDAINPKGKTPITSSVKHAFDLLGDSNTTVIVVSDGLETCGGDPCATVAAAKEWGAAFIMHVVGFDVKGEDVSQLECAAQAGGGLFFSAENADELGAALETAVAMPPDAPAGRLSVKVIANGKLHDAAVVVTDGDGAEAAKGRTYTGEHTNPRIMPLPDGKFHVRVKAVGIKGDTEREFDVEIASDALVEKTIDFSTGTITVGCTRNGALSDGLYHIYVAGTKEIAAQGRTYTKAKSNPATVTITSGQYDVVLGAIEIEGKPKIPLGSLTLEPEGYVEVSHDFASGNLEVGVASGPDLVDAVVAIYRDGEHVAQSRTYAKPATNPKTFVLEPGDYTIKVSVIKGAKYEATATVSAGTSVTTSITVE